MEKPGCLPPRSGKATRSWAPRLFSPIGRDDVYVKGLLRDAAPDGPGDESITV